jgi:hypothetical protein
MSNLLPLSSPSQPVPSPSESPCLQVLETSGNDRSGSPIIDTDKELMQCLALTVGMRAVLPSDHLSVSGLLKLCLPTFSSVTPSIEPEMCFANHPPTESVPTYLSRPVPPATFIDGLHNVARKAMFNGKLSIMDWTCKNSTLFFLFELIEFWSSLTRIIHARQKWEAASRWLEKAVCDDTLADEVDEVHLILQTTPWSADLQILRSHLTFLEMATFLSNNWPSSSQIDMALSTIAVHQLRICGIQEKCQYLIGTTILLELLALSPLFHNKKSSQGTLPLHVYNLQAPQDLQCAGAHLVWHQPDGEVVFIAYSPPGHWAAVSVTSQGTLEWADSLGRRPPSALVLGVQKWLRYHLPSSNFLLGNNFPCSQQTDNYSCGIIALNAIKHRIFGDTHWSAKSCAQLRIREFLDIMCMCHKSGGQKVCFHIF